MSFLDVMKDSVVAGFSYTDFSTTKILVTLLIAYAVALYIHLIYKIVTRRAFYYRNYGVSMAIMSVITAGIILAMQSSLVISLGMVGALSIVRFRTAIKDPMDLLFLFWSIGNGIICGAGLFELAILASLVATVGIFAFELMPSMRATYLVVVNTTTMAVYDEVIDVIKQHTAWHKVKTKNVNKQGMELILEVKLKSKEQDEKVLNALFALREVENVNFLENNPDVKS